MEEIRKNVLDIEKIKREISRIELLEHGEGDNISYEIKNLDTIKGLFENNYETISETISSECKDGKKISEFFNNFFEDDDVYASVKALLLDRLFNEVVESKTQPQQELLNTQPEQTEEVTEEKTEQTEQVTEEKSEQEKSTSAQELLQEQHEIANAQEQQTLEPANQNAQVMLNVAEQPQYAQKEPLEEATEEKSEAEKSTSAEAQLLSGQNEPVEVKKPAEQVQFDPSQMISLENEQISLINSCIHALDREVRTLQDENEELLIKNNNQLVVFRLIYNEEQKRMLRLRQTIDGLKKYRENHNIETDGHRQFVNKIKNNYGFGFIQPKNATQCGAIQSQLIYSDDEERKRKERRELALTTYKALVDLNKETNRGLLQ